MVLADIGDLVQLRLRLRHATADSHSTLDGLAAPHSLADPAHYAHFLACQYRARLPIERFVASSLPSELAPPPLTDAIACDLHDCGVAPPDCERGFALPDDADAIGLVWAIAGSHLGNRTMLKQLSEAGGQLPTRFLADESMAAFWQGLRPQLGEMVTSQAAGGAIIAAEAVFAQFARAFASTNDKRIAA